MNIPNILTVLRLLFAPVFIYAYMVSDSFPSRLIAVAIFLLASATDVLDGYIARKYNKITDFGKLADPVADKLMQLSVLSCLSAKNRISVWILILYAVKETLLLLGGLNLLKNNFVVQSKWSGKIATVVLFISVMIILLTDEITLSKSNATLLMCISMAVTLIALFDYAKMYLKVKENISKTHKEI